MTSTMARSRAIRLTAQLAVIASGEELGFVADAPADELERKPGFAQRRDVPVAQRAELDVLGTSACCRITVHFLVTRSGRRGVSE